MSNLWKEIKDNVKEWSSAAIKKADEVSKLAVEKTGDFTKVSKIKLDIRQTQKDIDKLNQTYLKVLGREYDKSKVDEGSVISTILFKVTTLSLDQQLSNLIDNTELDNSEASQELINLNSSYKLYMKSIADLEAVIFEKMTDNLAVIEKTQPWYVELITDFNCDTDCVNYLLHDEGHKSRIASSRFLYVDGHGNLIKKFHADLLDYKSTLEGLIVE